MSDIRCKYCEKYFPVTDFGVAKTTPEKIYRRKKCRYCYRATKQALIERYTSWMNEYKRSRGCGVCSINDPRVLDFHHRRDEMKLFTIGGFRNTIGIDRVRKEVEKCDIVCANCHRILNCEERAMKLGTRSLQSGKDGA